MSSPTRWLGRGAVGASRPSRGPSSACSTRGSVTAEAALVIPVLVMVGLFSVGVLGLVASYHSCAEAARQAARMLARGDAAAEAYRVATRLAPGTSVTHVAGDDVVVVTVRADIPVGVGPLHLQIPISAESVAAQERVW